MKKAIALVLALVMLAAMCACSEYPGDSEQTIRELQQEIERLNEQLEGPESESSLQEEAIDYGRYDTKLDKKYVQTKEIERGGTYVIVRVDPSGQNGLALINYDGSSLAVVPVTMKKGGTNTIKLTSPVTDGMLWKAESSYDYNGTIRYSLVNNGAYLNYYGESLVLDDSDQRTRWTYDNKLTDDYTIHYAIEEQIFFPTIDEESITAAEDPGAAARYYLFEEERPAGEKTPEPINYAEYTVRELFDDMNSNQLRAEQKHQNEYVAVSGYIHSFDSDGKYFSLGTEKDDWDYLFDTITCRIKTDAVRNQVIDYNTYDYVTVYGKITDIGEILGYYMDVDKIG